MEMDSSAQMESQQIVTDTQGTNDGDEGVGDPQDVPLPTPTQLDADIQAVQDAAAAEEEQVHDGKFALHEHHSGMAFR